jgi:hypothetical protein
MQEESSKVKSPIINRDLKLRNSSLFIRLNYDVFFQEGFGWYAQI